MEEEEESDEELISIAESKLDVHESDSDESLVLDIFLNLIKNKLYLESTVIRNSY